MLRATSKKRKTTKNLIAPTNRRLRGVRTQNKRTLIRGPMSGQPHHQRRQRTSKNECPLCVPKSSSVLYSRPWDLLEALPRLIVNNMARGVYLIGSKLAQRVRAVQIVDCAGNSTTLRLKDYMSQKIEPEYKTLPWQQDVAVLLSTNEKPKK
jgi:hypothetical protein